jgi:hypothetical protein
MRKLYKTIAHANILKNTRLRNILIASLVIVTVVPAYSAWFIYPSFANLLIESAKHEASSAATHFSSMLFSEAGELRKDSVRQNVIYEIERIKRNFKLTKLKVFSKSGEILFSTDPQDIGNINTEKYFREIIAKGTTRTKFVQKDGTSLEGQKITADVVEAYVPIMSGDKFIGVFEIYYDVTETKKKLDSLVLHSSITVATLALGLMIAIGLLLLKENRVISERKQAEQKRESLISELQKALSEVKTLSGLLPFCASCKKVRDDKGYWRQVETYIHQHTNAKVSHGICPDCAKKLYGEFFDDEFETEKGGLTPDEE